MATISQPDVSALPVALPPTEEQHQMVLLVDAHDARIRTEEAYRDKLQKMKRGLMADLLTGRVRV